VLGRQSAAAFSTGRQALVHRCGIGVARPVHLQCLR
jgi:hypothetical protein